MQTKEVIEQAVSMSDTLSHNMMSVLLIEIAILGCAIGVGTRFVMKTFKEMTDEKNKLFAVMFKEQTDSVIEITKVLTKNSVLIDRNVLALDNVSQVVKVNERQLDIARKIIEAFRQPGDRRHESP